MYDKPREATHAKENTTIHLFREEHYPGDAAES